MGLVHVLDDRVRELISAGEVVERPASFLVSAEVSSAVTSTLFIGKRLQTDQHLPGDIVIECYSQL